MTFLEMVEKFQCPGCVCGGDTDCGSFKRHEVDPQCKGHVLGTFMIPGHGFALGLPKGFNKPGFDFSREPVECRNQMIIRLWTKDEEGPVWDNLNVPVWALSKDGFVFVRTYAPRINMSWVDVIENGTFPLGAIDVASFIDDID